MGYVMVVKKTYRILNDLGQSVWQSCREVPISYEKFKISAHIVSHKKTDKLVGKCYTEFFETVDALFVFIT